MATISGNVKDAGLAPAERVVRAYLQANGWLAAQTVSDAATGDYSLTVGTTAPHIVQVLDDRRDTAVILLMHMDGVHASPTFTEETGRVVTRVGTPTVSTAQFATLAGNAAAGIFSGTGQHLTVPDSPDFVFGSSDFTLECMIRPAQVTTTGQILGKSPSGAFGSIVVYQVGTQLGFLASMDGSSWGVNILSAASAVVVNTWYHVAVTRVGNVFTLYKNGVSIGTATVAGSVSTTTEPFRIGTGDGLTPFNGYIDEVRVTKKSGAVPVPAAPYSVFAPVSGGSNALIFANVVPV